MAKDEIERGDYANAIINARKYLRFFPESEKAKEIVRRGIMIRDEKVRAAQQESAWSMGWKARMSKGEKKRSLLTGWPGAEKNMRRG